MPDNSTDNASDNDQITIVDLQNFLVIIDVASQRGAFKGPELGQVGQVFDKINRIVQKATPNAAAQQASTDTPVSASYAPPFAQQ
jgi:hypothetical protein